MTGCLSRRTCALVIAQCNAAPGGIAFLLAIFTMAASCITAPPTPACVRCSLARLVYTPTQTSILNACDAFFPWVAWLEPFL